MCLRMSFSNSIQHKHPPTTNPKARKISYRSSKHSIKANWGSPTSWGLRLAPPMLPTTYSISWRYSYRHRCLLPSVRENSLKIQQHRWESRQHHCWRWLLGCLRLQLLTRSPMRVPGPAASKLKWQQDRIDQKSDGSSSLNRYRKCQICYHLEAVMEKIAEDMSQSSSHRLFWTRITSRHSLN